MIYELILRGSYFGQQWLNRFHYVSTAIPSGVLGSFGLTFAFVGVIVDGQAGEGTVARNIQLLQSTSVQYTSIEARAASEYDVSDFYQLGVPVAYKGLRPGEPDSPANAYGFRSNRTRLDIRRGAKRFVGVVSDDVGFGGIINTGFLPLMQNVAFALSWTLQYQVGGSTISYVPAIVSKQQYTTPSGKRSYRYYPTLEQQLANTSTSVSWSLLNSVRTQRSRQYGVGS